MSKMYCIRYKIKGSISIIADSKEEAKEQFLKGHKSDDLIEGLAYEDGNTFQESALEIIKIEDEEV